MEILFSKYASYAEAYLEPSPAVAMELFLQKKKKKLSAFSYQEQPLEVFFMKSCSKKFAKSTGKHLDSLFFNEIACLRLGTLLRKRLWLRRFPLIFIKS